MKALVANCSAPYYNLGARKLADWLRAQGHDVAYHDGDPGLWAYGYDMVALSVIFSWHALIARDIALRVKDHADIWCGGPGMFALASWWKKETGLDAVKGLDWRFERQRGDYRMTFASRGCPVNCYFCLTPETLIQTSAGMKSIASVKTGDLVLTHLGHYCPVTRVIAREYEGEVYGLRNGAISELFPTVVTPEHPVWMRHISYPTGGAHLTRFQWVNARDVKPRYSRYSRDVSVFPRVQDTDLPENSMMPGTDWLPCNNDTMSLIGWYLAEGYATQAPKRGYYRITFCLGHADSEAGHADRIIATAGRLGLRAMAYHLKIGIRVFIHNVKFTRWLVANFGTGASTKHLPLWLRCLPSEMHIPMLDSWQKGDGWYQKKKGMDTWKINTSSPDLAVSLREVVLKMGFLATINRHHQSDVIQGRKVSIKPSYTVIYHIPRENGRTVISDEKNVYSRIKDSVQYQYKGIVYNLEVAEDNSYCTAAFALHNCIVPRIEGTTFTLDYDFVPAPILGDNNLSALPVEFQEHIIRRYRETGTPLLDANSGFEPRTFDEGTYTRWKPVLRGPWRFAYDEMAEGEYVARMMRVLATEPPWQKRVYVLIGNEPIASCHERAQKVIEWGGEPYCQPLLPLNALARDDFKVAYDWTPQLLKDFTRFYNKWLWRSMSLAEYKPRVGKLAPFSEKGLAQCEESVPDLPRA